MQLLIIKNLIIISKHTKGNIIKVIVLNIFLVYGN